MNQILNLIVCNPKNKKVLAFLKFNLNNKLISVIDKNFSTHDCLESFLEIDVPSEAKFMLGNNGIIIIPSTGEIIAFQFNKDEKAIKISFIRRFFSQIYLLNFSLSYYTTIYMYEGYEVDISELGENWVLAVHFPGTYTQRIKEYFKIKLI